ncbi:cation transporter [uncultured Algibacter sp.]|uniref:heavy-metal-associated domain-containing protein n=1 Tax=uncultured Algibacter sp. TaxID=298659 RepID=UPI00261B79AA|nr:cation transporter [uncultured Algibacter sp.]
MKTTLYIQHLKCADCESIIIKKLSDLENIYNITIKLQYATVTFEHETKEDVAIVKQTLSRIGYPPYGEKNTFAKKSKLIN